WQEPTSPRIRSECGLATGYAATTRDKAVITGGDSALSMLLLNVLSPPRHNWTQRPSKRVQYPATPLGLGCETPKCSRCISPSHGENRGSSPLGSASNSNDLAPMGCLFELLWGVFGE